MKVINLNDVPNIENNSSLFTAPVTLQSPVTEKESQYAISWVHFPEGVRNKFHTHTCDQVLIVTEGKGMIANEKEEIDIAKGDIILIPAGEKHRHGAKPGSSMTHIAILLAHQEIQVVGD
jgi:quercetin dioxygenase-like cupin family protein